MWAGVIRLGLPATVSNPTFISGIARSALTSAKPIRWVNDTLPPRARARWLLMTTRLSMRSLTGTVRTLVAVGTVRLVSMLVTVRAEAPRSTTWSGWRSPSPESSVVGWSFGTGCATAAAVAGCAAGAAVSEVAVGSAAEAAAEPVVAAGEGLGGVAFGVGAGPGAVAAFASGFAEGLSDGW